jgi:hypothetical protein
MSPVNYAYRTMEAVWMDSLIDFEVVGNVSLG